MTRCSDDGDQRENSEDFPSEIQKKRKKRGKHVSFPPDEQIVSGFAEHRDWDRAGELLLFYTIKR